MPTGCAVAPSYPAYILGKVGCQGHNLCAMVRSCDILWLHRREVRQIVPAQSLVQAQRFGVVLGTPPVG